MGLMDDNLIDFWKTLKIFEVQYIIVGDIAVTLHGVSRTTKIIDI